MGLSCFGISKHVKCCSRVILEVVCRLKVCKLRSRDREKNANNL